MEVTTTTRVAKAFTEPVIGMTRLQPYQCLALVSWCFEVLFTVVVVALLGFHFAARVDCSNVIVHQDSITGDMEKVEQRKEAMAAKEATKPVAAKK